MYLILLYSKDGRSWLCITDDGKPQIAHNVTAVELSQYRWRRLNGAPSAPGSGIFYFDVQSGQFVRAPLPALEWDGVISAVTPASN
jgi:hypothetical protein